MSMQKNPIKVWLFTKLFRFSSWLQSIPNKIIPPPFRLIQMGSAFWQSRALYAAASLDIASMLGDDSLSAEAISAKIGTEPDATYRLLRMLAAMGIFQELSPQVFRNNALSSYLRQDNPQNVRAMVLMHNSDEMAQPWYGQLERGLKTGQVPFQLVHGRELYAYMDSHAEFDALFSQAMDSVQALTGDSFATDFDWSRFGRVIDVGGSKGSKSVALLKRHSQLSALVFDRAQVIQVAENYWLGNAPASLLARLSFQAGDMLQAVPAARDAKDVYLLTAVLHGMADGDCVKVLGNLKSASAGIDARVVLMELVMPDCHADFSSAAFDMQMFVGTKGRERTLAEWRALFGASGWRLEQVVGLQSMGNMLVLRQTSLDG